MALCRSFSIMRKLCFSHLHLILNHYHCCIRRINKEKKNPGTRKTHLAKRPPRAPLSFRLMEAEITTMVLLWPFLAIYNQKCKKKNQSLVNETWRVNGNMKSSYMHLSNKCPPVKPGNLTTGQQPERSALCVPGLADYYTRRQQRMVFMELHKVKKTGLGSAVKNTDWRASVFLKCSVEFLDQL